MFGNRRRKISKRVHEAVESERHYPPPSLDEAKLRFQLAASQYSLAGIIRSRPVATVAISLVAGLLLGRSSRLRKAFTSAVSRGLIKWPRA